MGLEPLSDMDRTPRPGKGALLAILFLGSLMTLALAPLALWLDDGHWDWLVSAIEGCIWGMPEAFRTGNFPSGMLRLGVLLSMGWVPFRVVVWSWRSIVVLSSTLEVTKWFGERLRHLVGCCLAYGIPVLALAVREWDQELLAWVRIRWAHAFLNGDHWRDEYWQGVCPLVPYLPNVLMVVSASVWLGLLVVGNWEYRLRSSKQTGKPKDRPEVGLESVLWMLLLLPAGAVGIVAGDYLMGSERQSRNATQRFGIFGLCLMWFGLIAVIPSFWVRLTAGANRGLAGMDPELGFAAQAVEILLPTMGQEQLTAHLAQLARTEGHSEPAESALFWLGREASAGVPEILRAFPLRSNRERGDLLDLLERLDPQWSSRPEVAALTPSFCDFLQDLSWIDDYWHRPQTWNEKARGSEFIGATLEETGENVLRGTGHGTWGLRTIKALNEADPGWKKSPAGVQLIQRLKQAFDPHHRDSLHHAKPAVAAALLRRFEPDWRPERKAPPRKP